jgi:membrane-bound lytic murein transglycosylase MltF
MLKLKFVATRLQTVRSGNKIFSSLKRPERLWALQASYLMGKGYFPAKRRTGCDGENSLLSAAEVVN